MSGFSGAQYKGFATLEEAEDYVNVGGSSSSYQPQHQPQQHHSTYPDPATLPRVRLPGYKWYLPEGYTLDMWDSLHWKVQDDLAWDCQQKYDQQQAAEAAAAAATTNGHPTSSSSTQPLSFAPSAPARSQQQQPSTSTSSSTTASHPYRRQPAPAQGQSSTRQFSTSATSPPAAASSSSANLSFIRHGIIFCDGAAKGNPFGPIGCGGLLYETRHGDSPDQCLETFKRYLGPRGTNNESEYQGMIIGMELALKHKITHLTIKMDSELVAKQMCGDYKVKAQNLQALHQTALGLAAQFESCQVQHIYREENALADQLANEAISDQRGY